METNRDDFVIAVRSAFIKKSTQQKFSLLALIVASVILLSLEANNSKTVNFFRSIVKDVIYRSAFIIEVPSNFFSSATNYVKMHYKIYGEYELLKSKVRTLENIDNEISYLKTENSKLNEAIGQNNIFEKKRIISKILIDKGSPYLKSVILNKGSNSDFKKGMPVLDDVYLIGRITEVNYLSSRVLLISDLNSKIPVIIEPEGYQAIMTGDGESKAILNYLPTKHKLKSGDTVYTSGADGIFLPGTPIGKVQYNENEGKIFVEFFSELSQLYFVKVIIPGKNGELKD